MLYDVNQYHLPLFGKISQKAKRNNVGETSEIKGTQISEEFSRSNNSIKEDCFISQDLFLTAEDKSKPTNFDNKLKLQLQMSCGEPAVRDSKFKSELKSPDELPHPKKLFGRKRSYKQINCKEKKPKPDFSGMFDIHRNQLKSKQARRSLKMDIIKSTPDLLTNSLLESPSTHQSEKDSKDDLLSNQFTLKPSLHKVSTWDEVENWVHQRWKWNNTYNQSKLQQKEE